MKKSAKISLWASIIKVTVLIILIALVQPLREITMGRVPVMIYVLFLYGAVHIAVGYVLIPKIELMEERGE